MIPSSLSIGIGISTKNRWKDLEVTLTHLHDEGLDRMETIVIDDGSDTPAPSELLEKFPWVKFERFEKSAGNLPRRNRLGSLLSTDFYLSLDDDSYPVAGDLEAAANWMTAHPKVAALAFRVIFANDPVPDVSQPQPPVLCKDFINCASLLRRDIFLVQGGFETRLHFYHEEPEYSFRTFQSGYDNYAWPSVIIRHVVTTAARPQARRTRFFIRNVVLMDLWYYPGIQAFTRALAHLPLLYQRLPKLRQHPVAMVHGWLEGFFCYFAWGKLKRPLTREQLSEWNARPGCHKATGSKTPL
jgi:Glycosyl transferase family 2